MSTTNLDSFDRGVISAWEQENDPDYPVTEQRSNTPAPNFAALMSTIENPEIQARFLQVIHDLFGDQARYNQFKQSTPEEDASRVIQARVLARKVEKEETAKIVKQKLNDLIDDPDNAKQVQSLLDSKEALASYFQIDLDDLPDDNSYLPDNLEEQQNHKQEQIRRQAKVTNDSIDDLIDDLSDLEEDLFDEDTGHDSKLDLLDDGNALFTDIDCCDLDHIHKVKQKVAVNPDGQPKLTALTDQKEVNQYSRSEIDAICRYGAKQGRDTSARVVPQGDVIGNKVILEPGHTLSYNEALSLHDIFVQQERDIKAARAAITQRPAPKKAVERTLFDQNNPFQTQ